MNIKSIIKSIATLLVIAAPAQTASAQADAQYSQYYEVPTFYNPAAVGATDYLKIRGGSRLQWIGIDNAPTSFLATADMPYKFLGKRVGFGLMINQESIGLYKNLSLGVQLGYKIKLFGGELTIGAQVGMYDQSFSGSEVYLPDDDDYHQSTDEAIPMNDIRGTALDVAGGIFYQHKRFWAGLSCTHANSPTITLNAESGSSDTENNYEFQAGRTVYFIAGSNIPIKNTLFEIIPSILVKGDFTFTTGEITARVRYNKFLSFGVGNRYNDAVYGTIAAEIKGFYIGYSYDYPTTSISKATSGSHEVFVGYSMKLDFSDKNKNKHKSIRIM
jgi:type IX secretion system PorP/SprF family membrane protein